jgi:hypothetical protein
MFAADQAFAPSRQRVASQRNWLRRPISSIRTSIRLAVAMSW